MSSLYINVTGKMLNIKIPYFRIQSQTSVSIQIRVLDPLNLHHTAKFLLNGKEQFGQQMLTSTGSPGNRDHLIGLKE